ncbi:MAG: aminotransferase [Candidatus Angelobacter sp. Gp1-AA117]|nr:MAG: aminotransferase [Candidatus Angelobacter sp. Gp1-AA117]
MNVSRSTARSPYMEWAKLQLAAKYNLATSGMISLPLAELGVKIEELEINGPSIYGYDPLLKAIADRYRVPQESVVSAVGTSLANYLALAAITEPGDEVLIEQPSYGPILDVAQYLGLTVRRFARPAEMNFALDLADLERQLTPRTRALVICNLHNPSGAFIPNPVLGEVATLARKTNTYIVVDEVYREMLFEQEPQTAFHLDPERFIITNSLTKAYGLSGLRCGWLLAPSDIAERMWHINDLHGATFAHPAELLSVIAFSKLDQISAHMKALLDTNRALLKNFLDSRNDLDYFWPEYGTIVFPRLRTEKSSWSAAALGCAENSLPAEGKTSTSTTEEFCTMLRNDFDTSVVPGRFFETPSRFRMGVGIATEAVKDALNQLERALDKILSPSRP